MRLRTDAHHSQIETGEYPFILPKFQRVCQKCTWGTTVEDESHVLSWTFHLSPVRLKYEHALFAGFGGDSQVAKSVRL
jgi:hypothetical protein